MQVERSCRLDETGVGQDKTIANTPVANFSDDRSELQVILELDHLEPPGSVGRWEGKTQTNTLSFRIAR